MGVFVDQLCLSALLVTSVLLLRPLHVSSSSSLDRVQWRYTDYAAHSQQLLSYRNQVSLQTPNNISIPATCSVVDFKRASYIMECFTPGFHKASLHSGFNDVTIHIPLDNSPFCYTWSTSSQYSQVNSTSQVLLRVWVRADPGAEEVDRLTTQFHSLGESPSVVITTPGLEATISHEGYSSICSCWSFLIISPLSLPYEFTAQVSGRDVIIFNCGVRPTDVLISRAKLLSSDFIVSSNSTIGSSSSGEDLKLYQDPVVTGVVLIIRGDQTLVTQDDFQTISSFQIDDLPTPLEAVAITQSTLCLLVHGSLIVLALDRPDRFQPSGVPRDGIQHLTTGSGEWVSIWTEMDNVFYLSTNGGVDFQEILLPLDSSSEEIMDIVFHPGEPEANVLITLNNSTQALFLRYNVETHTWLNSGRSFETTGGRLSVKFFPSVFGDLLLWDDSAIYHSPNRGLTVRKFTVYQLSSTDSDSTFSPYSWSAANDSIKQVALGRGGQFALLSSSNRLFYGTTHVGYGVEIQSGEGPYSDALLVFNRLGELKIVSTVDGQLTSRKVPTYSLLLSSLHPPPACPYIRWEHSIEEPVYYLDTGDRLELWASLIPRQWTSNYITVLYSDPQFVNVTVGHQLTQTAIEGSVERNLTVYIQPKYTEYVSKARTAVKLSASSQHLACPKPAEAVTLVSIQCPPTRNIRIKRPASQSDNDCPLYNGLHYTIEGDFYDPDLKGRRNIPGNIPKVVEYNVTKFGCPIRLPFTQPYKPALELYDGDRFVKQVPVDFVVWELHGRTDFKYSATAQQVGCVSAPQNWIDLLRNETHPSLAWTPQTYRSCFESGGDPLTDSAPYQILNRTGGSNLLWVGHNGVYIMVAHVVAPGYSYCVLTTTFAIEIYGAISYSFIGYILLAMTCLIGAISMLISYYIYRCILTTKLKKLPKVE